MIYIKKQKFLMGSSNPCFGYKEDRESPATLVQVKDFLIDETPVTNLQFNAFIEETGYVTQAEQFGWSYVFYLFLSPLELLSSHPVPKLKWWRAVPGATWLYPEGHTSVFPERKDHPVTQVSQNDAIAYCHWANKRLPTEAEWECAAKGGTDYELFPWGDQIKESEKYCNTWQGNFPYHNNALDGFIGTAPVYTYESNLYGLYQMIGNVWEWCCNPARISLDQFNFCTSDVFWENAQHIDDLEYAVKGGSFLCHDSYCKRYRIAARNGATAMSSSNNTGFRCVKSC